MRLLAVQRVIGAVVALSGAFMLPPLGLSLLFEDGIEAAFLESMAISVVAGLALWLPVRKVRTDLRLRDGFIVTTAKPEFDLERPSRKL